ncbi:CoA-binding protein [Natrarchaeobius halalkaliphilus]|uniref:CoA-binding protein n=1 Tax=Natrarchaeobius halalkaliphilus TaxID=1679091 RepID=A0A3N6MWU8_9EURY|nr:CoA-binding protein [Natrarchaeobius halalkaliphilus]RQG89962.1 CoA-binding protein [Natrarchaeobius halalkaliphilus]
MPVESDVELRDVLSHETIAVVGCSSTPGKAAHDVPLYLDERGYDVIPVNPFADEIFGRSVPDTLSDVDEGVEVVCVFRPSEEVGGIVDGSLEREDVEAIWMQQGIRDDEAAARAEDDGRTVVQNRCMKIEHRRLVA